MHSPGHVRALAMDFPKLVRRFGVLQCCHIHKPIEVAHHAVVRTASHPVEEDLKGKSRIKLGKIMLRGLWDRS